MFVPTSPCDVVTSISTVTAHSAARVGVVVGIRCGGRHARECRPTRRKAISGLVLCGYLGNLAGIGVSVCLRERACAGSSQGVLSVMVVITHNPSVGVIAAILLQGKRACSSKGVLTNVRRRLAPWLFEGEDMYEGVVVQGNYCNNIQQSESGGRPPGAAREGVGICWH